MSRLTMLRWWWHGEKHPWNSGHLPNQDFQRCGRCFEIVFKLAHGGRTYCDAYHRVASKEAE